MTRLEKCELLEQQGFKYNPETGDITGFFGNVIKRKDIKGYINIYSNHIKGNLLGHHFAWYMVYGNVDFIELDHQNRIKDDNRISNLRISSRSEQRQNTEHKGYYYHKKNNNWVSRIVINKKMISLGSYNTEQEARTAYLNAKQKYHNVGY